MTQCVSLCFLKNLCRVRISTIVMHAASTRAVRGTVAATNVRYIAIYCRLTSLVHFCLFDINT